MDWVLLSVLSVLGFTAMAVVQKRALDRYVAGAVPFNAIASLMQLSVAAVLLAIAPPDDWFSGAVLLMVAAGTLQALQWLLQLYALSRATDITRIIPIMDSFPLVVLIISVAILGEVLTPLKWIAVLFVIGGATLASLSQAIPGERVRLNRPFAAILGAVTFTYGITRIVHIIASMGRSGRVLTEQLENVNEWAKYHDFPAQLIAKMKVYLHYKSSHSYYDEESVVSGLNMALRRNRQQQSQHVVPAAATAVYSEPARCIT